MIKPSDHYYPSSLSHAIDQVARYCATRDVSYWSLSADDLIVIFEFLGLDMNLIGEF